MGHPRTSDKEGRGPAKRYNVALSQAERVSLDELTDQGMRSARKLKRAHHLIKASAGWTDERIGAALDTARTTVARTRQGCVERGLAGALTEAAAGGAGGGPAAGAGVP